MKTLPLLVTLTALAIAPVVLAQKGPNKPEDPAPAPATPPPVYENPPVTTAAPQPPAAPAQGQTYVYDQQPMGTRPVLITQDQAQAIINNFKAAYPKIGSPRFLIFVNRALVDEQSGMKLIHRSEQIEGSRSSAGTNSGVHSVEKNEYRSDGKAQPSLADRQTVRDVERLFGRPLRAAGASLADQRVAAELIADKPLDEFIGTTDTPQARKDREALGKITDAVIEILISSKTVTVPAISGSRTISVPDIQATAIRLNDAKILGQASSTDATARVPASSLESFDVHQITEATALALMEDMTPR